ncbi:endonuclease domain-containing protein [Asticcacaulis sp. BYS171W]|uniref:Endonuclease domain-containing protein n=1 Tax=Asticcacaulis aquaticus TaxID=2984212 RepID=A0ABT5HUA4_9CAUL|nr:endonuclease domain-containing protein [Asticcacaulis aquaticus]
MHSARTLRRKLTPPEFMLWDRLKVRQDGGPVFRRQYAVGPYVLDMYCFKAKLAVEVDGQQHGLENVAEKDVRRDEWLKSQGIETYRINASDIYRNADEVADGVYRLAAERLKDLR